MQNESRQEPGCIRYAFYASLEDPDRVRRGRGVGVGGGAAGATSQAPSVAGFGAKLGDLIDRPPEVSIHVVEKTNDFPDLDWADEALEFDVGEENGRGE